MATIFNGNTNFVKRRARPHNAHNIIVMQSLVGVVFGVFDVTRSQVAHPSQYIR
jgi:ribosomal protein S19